MGRPQKPVDRSNGAVAQFASELRDLRSRAGWPTYRDMAKSALFSPSVLSSAASGHRLPTLQVTLAFVAACGGDREVWKRRWLQVSDGLLSQPSPHAGSRPVPPVQPVLPHPAQLPSPARGFVGRAGELRELYTPSTLPVVISGPVGVGKTELALHFAHDIAAEMVDGQLHADFGARERLPDITAVVLDGLLRALGIPAAQIPESVAMRAGLYRSLLAARRLVVVLDNVRDENQVRPLLVDTRRSVTVIVGRTPLLGLRDVRRVRLGVLPRADALEMIATALPERAAADPQACDRLAELCGDLPLALDIAIRRLQFRPELTVRELVGRLREPGTVLDWLRIGDQSVRSSLDSALVQLGQQTRALMRHLALLPSDLQVTAAGSRDGTVVLYDDLVEELAEAGVLRPGNHPGAWRLDPLARALLLERPPAPPRVAPTARRARVRGPHPAYPDHRNSSETPIPLY